MHTLAKQAMADTWCSATGPVVHWLLLAWRAHPSMNGMSQGVANATAMGAGPAGRRALPRRARAAAGAPRPKARGIKVTCGRAPSSVQIVVSRARAAEHKVSQ